MFHNEYSTKKKNKKKNPIQGVFQWTPTYEWHVKIFFKNNSTIGGCSPMTPNYEQLSRKINCIVLWTHSMFILIAKTICYYIQSVMALWCTCAKILDQKFMSRIRNNRLLDQMAMVSSTNNWNKMVIWNFGSHTWVIVDLHAT
jgi:hypothetical protein